MTLRERKKDKTRAALLSAALDLFSRQGFADTTIVQIAEAADVSPRTLLRYFPSKEDVIVSWVEEGMSVFLMTMASRPPAERPQNSLLASARAMLEHYQSQGDFYLTIERVIASSPEVRARKLEMSATLAEEITALLWQRNHDADDHRWPMVLYPAVIFAMLRSVIDEWVAREGKDDLVALFNEAAAHIKLK